MKANCWMGKKQVEVRNVPDPQILNPRDAIVRITSTAICGSDLHLYNGFMPTMAKGDVLGHEFMGEVVDVGRDVTNLKVGDRVVVPFPIACGNCHYCKRGLWSLCDVAGWRLADGLRGARVDGGGRLNGLRAEPGRSSRAPCEEMTRLLRALFHAAGEGIAGRGEARRAARELERRWRNALDRVSADRVVADLVGVAPWLLEIAAARDGREGVVVRDGVEIAWSAGPASERVHVASVMPPAPCVRRAGSPR